MAFIHSLYDGHSAKTQKKHNKTLRGKANSIFHILHTWSQQRWDGSALLALLNTEMVQKS